MCWLTLSFSYSHSAGPFSYPAAHSAASFFYFYALAAFLSFFEVRFGTPVHSHAYYSLPGILFVMHFNRVFSVLPENLRLFVRALLVSRVTLPYHGIYPYLHRI